MVFIFLQSKEAVSELFREISQKIANRPGGYTRILKTGTRLGDNAEMCIIELVDYNENLLKAKDEKAGKSTRRKRSKKKADSSAEKVENKIVENKSKVEETVEAPVEEPTSATETQIEDKSEVEQKPENTENKEEADKE